MKRLPVQVHVHGPDADGDLLVTATTREGVEAGRLTAGTLRGDGAIRVRILNVNSPFRRQGVATSLYEAAAKASCSLYGLPLSSDDTRSPAAEGFWQKQERKERAVCKLRLEGGRCFRWWLRCPPPRSLAGGAGRRQR